MLFTDSLKKNYQFRFVYNKGKSIANRQLVMYILENKTEQNRLGVSVSKKVGKSVVRSHVTRLIKESYRMTEQKIKCGYDIIVIARNTAKDADFDEVSRSLRHLFKKHGLLKEG